MSIYESYQQTNIDWLPSIPSTWKAKRIKNLFSLRDERSYKPLSEVNLISLYTSLGVRQHSDIEHTTGNKARNADGYKIVNVDDIIVNIMLCWMGAIGRSAYSGVTSPAYDIYKPHEGVNSSYYHYLFRTPIFSQQCFRNGHGIMMMRWRTYSPEFTSIVVPVPPREEQDQIVRFLDWKVSEINRLINIKHKEIARLEELKKIAIHEAVTKGLNPDADMKDSGFDFIGEIPLHWRLIKLKWLLSSVLQYGANASGVEFRENLPRYIRITDITLDNKLKDDGKLSLSTEDATPYILHDKDILFARSGATVGKSFIYREEYGLAAFAGYLIRAQVNPSKANADFIYMVTLSKYYELWKNRIFIQATIQNISAEKYNNLPVPLPPIEEQVRIVEFVKHKIVQIEAAIENEKMQIQALHEFKTRLISDVVTGKIDVRGIEIPEYEYTAEEADTDSEAEAEDLDEGGEEI